MAQHDINIEELKVSWEKFNNVSLKDDAAHRRLVKAYTLYLQLYDVFGMDPRIGMMGTLTTLERQANLREEGRASGRRKPLPSEA
jgi:hypothetical protein